MIKTLFISGALFFSQGISACEENYIRAQVYYHDWAIDLRSPMTSEMLKDRFLTKLDIRDTDKIVELMRKLPIGEMLPSSVQQNKQDIRLRIDLTTSEGAIKTFLASRFLLFDKTGLSSAPLDAEFSQNFDLGPTWQTGKTD